MTSIFLITHNIKDDKMAKISVPYLQQSVLSNSFIIYFKLNRSLGYITNTSESLIHIDCDIILLPLMSQTTDHELPHPPHQHGYSQKNIFVLRLSQLDFTVQGNYKLGYQFEETTA